MPHALIIDDNTAISRAIQHYLADLGFCSFDHTLTEQQALAAARQRRPDIIVIGDTIAAGCAIRAARAICEDGAVPVLMASGDPALAARRLARASSYDGPFRINQIDEAVALALESRPVAH